MFNHDYTIKFRNRRKSLAEVGVVGLKNLLAIHVLRTSSCRVEHSFLIQLSPLSSLLHHTIHQTLQAKAETFCHHVDRIYTLIHNTSPSPLKDHQLSNVLL